MKKREQKLQFLVRAPLQYWHILALTAPLETFKASPPNFDLIKKYQRGFFWVGRGRIFEDCGVRRLYKVPIRDNQSSRSFQFSVKRNRKLNQQKKKHFKLS